MPEMRFRVRWPDGTTANCYSPSLVIKDFLSVGANYSLEEFLTRSRTALEIASERVRAKYGRPCSRAEAQLKRIETVVERFAAMPNARVIVDAFEN